MFEKIQATHQFPSKINKHTKKNKLKDGGPRTMGSLEFTKRLGKSPAALKHMDQWMNLG